MFCAYRVRKLHSLLCCCFDTYNALEWRCLPQSSPVPFRIGVVPLSTLFICIEAALVDIATLPHRRSRVYFRTWTPKVVTCCGLTLFPYLINNHRFSLYFLNTFSLQSYISSTRAGVMHALKIIPSWQRPPFSSTSHMHMRATLQLHNGVSILLLVCIHHTHIQSPYAPSLTICAYSDGI